MPRIPVVRADSPELRALAREIWRTADAARPRPAGALRAERVRHKIEAAELLLVAHYGTRPAGMLLAETYVADGVPDPEVGHLSMVFVDPAVWGSRVGTTLVRDLQGRQWSQLSAWTRTDNRRAQRLLLATGFVDSGARSTLQDGDELRQLIWTR
ncbi:N-acetyltransferase family protein [Nocardioides sp. DS6]|uniref:N-acetyltransferase family protein n=1 Tax=Nocardioides eburneus TaxID=3231482 RepID=A0ABV3T0M8_9ACTN